MVPLKSFKGFADTVCEMLTEVEMYGTEDDVSSIGGATKAVGNG